MGLPPAWRARLHGWPGRHPKAARRLLIIAALMLALTALGQCSQPVNFTGACRIYP